MEAANELLDRFLDGDASEEDRRQVLAWLETDAEAMKRLGDRAELHADLRRSLQRRHIQEQAVASIEESVANDPSFRLTIGGPQEATRRGD